MNPDEDAAMGYGGVQGRGDISREQYRAPWKRLSNSYSEHGIVLFLGAGVSKGSGIPDWESLIQHMMEAPELRGQVSFEALKKQAYSLTMIASFIQKTINDEKLFVKVLRESLYRDFPLWGQRITTDNASHMVEHTRAHNPTLKAVYDLAVDAEGEKIHPNPHVHAIVNLNLDGLLEAYDKAFHLVRGFAAGPKHRCLRTVERPSSTKLVGRTNVYHPHGFLRFDDRANDPKREAPELRVLSEQEYFEFFNNPTSVFTYTMLYMLREYTCVFIGLSMIDDNLRRLLYYSKAEREHGLRGRYLGKLKHSKPRHFAILGKQDDVALAEFQKVSLDSIGVVPVWVNSFADIPTELSGLRSGPVN